MKKEFKYIKNVPIELLLPHEQIQSHIVNYWDDMYINKSFIPAVAVSEENIIIDGHHRIEMCKQNGVKVVNVCQFQYFDPGIIIKGNFINKEEVFYSALSGILLEPQSSQHFINIYGSTKFFIIIITT